MSDPNDPATPDHDDEALIALIRDAVFPMTIAELAEASPLLSEHKIRVALDRLVGAGVLLSSPPKKARWSTRLPCAPGTRRSWKEGSAVSADAAAASPSPDLAAVAAAPTPAATRQALLEQLARTAGLTPEQRACLWARWVRTRRRRPSRTRSGASWSSFRPIRRPRSGGNSRTRPRSLKRSRRSTRAHGPLHGGEEGSGRVDRGAIAGDPARRCGLRAVCACCDPPYPEHGYRDVFRLDAIDPGPGRSSPCS